VKSYLMLVFVLCLLVGCGAEPMPTAAPTTWASIGDTWTRPADGAVMVYVPAGEFLMGSTEEDIDAVMAECAASGYPCNREWFAGEQPQHSVYLDAYWIDRTEVTNAQYRQCVEAGACEEPGCWENNYLNAPEQPVVCVSWYDARDYAAWVGGRLPTEAEWEKAARGTDGRIYPWGNNPPDCQKANYSGCAGNPLPVGSHPDGASPYGALDMAGNVWEWVADRYYEHYYRFESPFRNPQGPESGDDRVLRGGALDGQWSVRCAYRDRRYPPYWFNVYGFRVCVAARQE
jgi:formylglycine-generating enzyme required for sulfatase activity